MPNTVRFHRVLRAPPERVYNAFIDPDAMAKWLPPNGFTGRVHEMDARVGGGYRMSFTNFSTGERHFFGGSYVELTPAQRIVYADRFDDPNLPGEMRVTVTLKAVSVGTDLDIVQEGIPDVIPPEACHLGWQESLTLLARLVEADIRVSHDRVAGSIPRSGCRSDLGVPARRFGGGAGHRPRHDDLGGKERMLIPAHALMRTLTHLYHHQGHIVAMCRLLGRPGQGVDYPIT